MGHSVTVVTSNYYFPFPNYNQTVKPILGQRKRPLGKRRERGISTIRLKSAFQLPGGFTAWLSDLQPTLMKLEPDVVFANGVFQPLALQIALLKKKLGFQLIYDSHASSFNTDLQASFLKKTYMKIFKVIAVPFIKSSANDFTAVGESEKQTMLTELGLPPKKVKLIHLGADTDVFYPDQKSRQLVRQKLGVTNDQVLFVHAGKITENKDLHILIPAFAEVSRSKPELKMLIIGSGPTKYIKLLKKLAKNNDCDRAITWLPPLPHHQLAKHYRAADIGVWPGDLSNTIQECMACATSVVIARKISESQDTSHLSTSRGVFTYQRYSIISLSKTLSKLVLPKTKLKYLGAEAQKIIDRGFSWQQIAKHHLSLVQDE